MASLRDLMKNRGKKAGPKETGKSQPAISLPPPPPQVPLDLGTKQLLDPKKKRPLADDEEREVAPPKGTKQQKVVKDHRSKRALSIESRDEAVVADVRRGPRTWSPRLELDGAPIPWETSLRNYNGGRAGLVAEALEQPLLLPRDMESYRRFSQYDLFLSLKRDLAMITQQVYVAEEWNKKTYAIAQAEAHSRSEAEKSLDNLKEDYSLLSNQLKEMTKQRDSLDAGHKNTEK